MKPLRLLFGLALLASPVASQRFVAPYERVLIPIAIQSGALRGPIPGAYESQWVTELMLRNESSRYVEVLHGGRCAITCPRTPIDAKSSYRFVFRAGPGNGKGAFLHVALHENDLVSFNLRVQDISRQSLTWGTEIPVVRESEAHTEPIHLLNVPMDTVFRQTLRVYDFAPRSVAREVLVRVVPMNSESALLETTLRLEPYEFEGSFDYPAHPGYGQIDFAPQFPQLPTFGSVRVEISPITPDLVFWAFVSITNNDSQHVTTVTPQ